MATWSHEDYRDLARSTSDKKNILVLPDGIKNLSPEDTIKEQRRLEMPILELGDSVEGNDDDQFPYIVFIRLPSGLIIQKGLDESSGWTNPKGNETYNRLLTIESAPFLAQFEVLLDQNAIG